MLIEFHKRKDFTLAVSWVMFLSKYIHTYIYIYISYHVENNTQLEPRRLAVARLPNQKQTVCFSGQKTCKKNNLCQNQSDFSWKTAGTWQRVVGVEVLFIHIHQPHSVGYRGHQRHMRMPIFRDPAPSRHCCGVHLVFFNFKQTLPVARWHCLALLKVAHA